MRDWIGGIAAWCSRGVNCICLKGNPSMTVSARCFINREHESWNRARRIINTLFFWQADHCKVSFQSDVAYAMRVLTVRNTIKADCPTIGQKVVE